MLLKLPSGSSPEAGLFAVPGLLHMLCPQLWLPLQSLGPSLRASLTTQYTVHVTAQPSHILSFSGSAVFSLPAGHHARLLSVCSLVLALSSPVGPELHQWSGTGQPRNPRRGPQQGWGVATLTTPQLHASASCLSSLTGKGSLGAGRHGRVPSLSEHQFPHLGTENKRTHRVGSCQCHGR